MESFSVVMQFVLMPMFFLSGALFPLHNVPDWLSPLSKLDPVSYGMDPLRQAVLSQMHLPTIIESQLDWVCRSSASHYPWQPSY